MAHDISLLKLRRPAQINRHVNLACIPGSSGKVPDGKTCWVTGNWIHLMHSFREVFFLFCFRLRFYFRGNMSHAVKRPSTYWFCSKIKKLEIVMMFFFSVLQDYAVWFCFCICFKTSWGIVMLDIM